MKILVTVLTITLFLAGTAEAKRKKRYSKSTSKTSNHCVSLLKGIGDISHYGDSLKEGTVHRLADTTFPATKPSPGSNMSTSRMVNVKLGFKNGKLDTLTYKPNAKEQRQTTITFGYKDGKCFPREVKENGRLTFDMKACNNADRWLKDYRKKLADCKQMGVNEELKRFFNRLGKSEKSFVGKAGGDKKLMDTLLKARSKCELALNGSPSLKRVMKDHALLKDTSQYYDFDNTTDR